MPCWGWDVATSVVLDRVFCCRPGDCAGGSGGLGRDWAAVIFIVVCTIVGLLVLVLLFRGVILRRLTGRAEATVEDISGALITGVSAAVAQDRVAAEQAADKLARVALGWYAWSNFYRWVIGTALALLLAFASFTGTVLLFEQIAKLEDQTRVMQAQQELMAAQTAFMESQTQRLQEQTEAAAMQNEIMMLNLVNQLREQMLVTMQSGPAFALLVQRGYTWADEGLVRTQDGQCSLDFNGSHVLHSPPSETALRVLEDLARNATIGDRVREALAFLSNDQNGGVAFGATLVLDRLGNISDLPERVFRSVFVMPSASFYDFQSTRDFMFIDSVVDGLSCHPDACKVTSYGSFARFRALHTADGRRNVIMTRSKGTNKSFSYVSAVGADALMEVEDVPADHGPFQDAALIRSNQDRLLVPLGMLRQEVAFLKQTSVSACDTLQEIGSSERLFEYIE